MAYKLIIVSCLVAVAAAGPIAKLAYAEPQYPPAQYEYTYSIEDHQSGDIKQQKESRNGDAVQGFYSLIQPDGTQRIVDYTADDVHGFNAVVRYEGHPAPAKVAYAAPAKIAYQPAYAAPIAKVAVAQAAPVAYAAPVAKIAYQPAPVAKIAYAPAPAIEYAHHAPAHYATPAPAHYAPAPAHYAPAPAHYASAPAHYAPAPAHYAQAPAHYAQAPAHYAPAPAHYAAAPVAKVAYSTNLGHVTFSSPAVSYHH